MAKWWSGGPATGLEASRSVGETLCGSGTSARTLAGTGGVGSDLDVVLVLERSGRPFDRKGIEWDATDLRVPADLQVYTKAEWERMGRHGRSARAPWREAIWIYIR